MLFRATENVINNLDCARPEKFARKDHTKIEIALDLTK